MIEERERLASSLRAIGLEPLPSQANFLFVPVDDGRALGDALLRQGLVVRVYDDGDPDHDPRPRGRRPASSRRSRALLDRPVARAPTAAARRVRHLRATAETRIAVRLGLDGASRVRVDTGAGIYDHFLEQLAFHAGLDLVVEGAGDLETGDHHTVEDTALAFGEALDKALGDRRGIARYGDAVVPMDDALARAAVDLGGRPYAELKLEPEPGMAAHFFALARAGRAAGDPRRGERPRRAPRRRGRVQGGRPRAARRRCAQESAGIPSTKGAAVKVAVCDYRAGNIRSVEIALRRLGAELDRRRGRRRPRRAAGRRLGRLGDGRAPRAGPRRGAARAHRRRAAGARHLPRPAARARAVARRTAASTGSASSTGRSVRLRRAACRASAGRVEGRAGRRTAFYFAHCYAVETPAATAWSEGIVAEVRSGAFLGVQFHPEKSGAAGARYLDGVLAEVREQSLSRA